MKLDLKTLPIKLKPVLAGLKRHLILVFLVIVVGIYSFLVIKINMFSRIEPSEEQVDEVLKDVKRPKVDKAAVAKIQDLEDQNVQVQVLFKQARDNPFQE